MGRNTQLSAKSIASDLQTVWLKISSRIVGREIHGMGCGYLVESLPRRAKAVIATKGG